MTSHTLVLHGLKLSGHVHRVELMLRLLELPYRFVEATPDIRKSAAYLRLNPLGQVPVLEDGPVILADSNAILVYLAKRYAPGGSWLPDELVAAAHVQRWLSLAAGELMHGPCTARLITVFGLPDDMKRATKIAGRLFRLMEAQLDAHDFLAGPGATLADIAFYAYVAHAPEGGIALDPYPKIQAWLKRIEALPHFKAMPSSPLPASA